MMDRYQSWRNVALLVTLRKIDAGAMQPQPQTGYEISIIKMFDTTGLAG